MKKKTGKKAAKTTKTSVQEIVNQQADAAVEELERQEENEGYEEEDTGLDFSGLGAGVPTQDETFARDDVFEEGFRRATQKNTAVRFHIKKNSQFLAVKGYPYSWEKLQKEFGPGYYHVAAKAMNTGQILKQQTEMVGDPNEGQEVNEEVEVTQGQAQDNQLAILAMMNQLQERAEARAVAGVRTQENSMGQIMQAITTAQAESNKLMMTMMMENQKQTQTLLMAMMEKNNKPQGPDPIMTLLTTLITQKPTKDDGFTMANVLKMVQDAESRAETRATKNFEMIDKKATELAEIKAEAMGGDGEGEESFTKTLVKGFLPILPQIMAAQGQQPSPEQVALMQSQQIRNQNPALQEGFVEPALRKGVPAPANRQPPQARPQQRPVRAVQPVQAQSPAQPESTQVHLQSPPAGVSPAKRATEVQKKPETIVLASDAITDVRLKEEIMAHCLSDIGQAMVERRAASTVVGPLLDRLEKLGHSRQTIANTFSLQDFYAVAAKYGLPQEANDWLKEFHESIQETVFGQKSPQPTRTTERVEHVHTVAEQSNGPKPVAQGRSGSVIRRAGAKPSVNP